MTLIDDLSSSVLARSRYRRHSVTYPQLHARQDDHEWLARYNQVYVGNVSISCRTTLEKWLVYSEFPVSHGEMAREYLRRIYADGKRSSQFSPRAPGFTWEAPIFCVPTPRTRALAYVDIASCYWQLLRDLQPDSTWLPDSGVMVEGVHEWTDMDAVADARELRHAIAGIMFTSSFGWWTHGKWREVAMTKPWSNPSLKQYVMSTLHAIAAEVKERFDAVRWHTDGGIVGYEHGSALVDHLMDRWALRARIVAEGPGRVFNSTSFYVGDKQSLDIVNGARLRNLAREGFSNLRTDLTAEQLRQARGRDV